MWPVGVVNRCVCVWVESMGVVSGLLRELL